MVVTSLATSPVFGFESVKMWHGLIVFVVCVHCAPGIVVVVVMVAGIQFEC